MRIVRDGEKVIVGWGRPRKELVNSWGWPKGQ